jgi:methyl-accepting chemotaxis protein
MKNKNPFFQFFLFHYIDMDVEIQSKSRYILIVNLVMSASCFIFLPFCLFNLVAGMTPSMIPLILFALIPYMTDLYFLRKGNLTAAMWITSLTLLCLTAFGKLLLPVTPNEDISTFGFLILAFLLGINVISNRFSIILVSTIIGLIAIIIRGFYQVGPTIPKDKLASYGGTLFVAFFFYLLGFFFIVMISRLNRKIIDNSKNLASENQKKVFRLQDTVKLAGSSLEIGSDLKNSTDNIRMQLTGMNEKVAFIAQSSKELRGNMESIREANHSILITQESVQKNIDTHNTMVSETSSAIEKVTGTVNFMVQITTSRLEDLVKLSEFIHNGYDSLNNLKKSAEELEQQTANIRDFLSVIQSVSEQTNMLAMNAAIEAAHAGEYGKGFAVVAGEIRILADSTNENVNRISNIIELTIKQVNKTSQVLDYTNEIFNGIYKKIESFTSAMQEIQGSIVSIHDSVKGIAQTASTVQESAQELDMISGKLKTKMNESGNSVSAINQRTEEFDHLVDELKTSLLSFDAEVEKISSVAKQNKQQLENLKESVAKV